METWKALWVEVSLKPLGLIRGPGREQEQALCLQAIQKPAVLCTVQLSWCLYGSRGLCQKRILQTQPCACTGSGQTEAGAHTGRLLDCTWRYCIFFFYKLKGCGRLARVEQVHWRHFFQQHLLTLCLCVTFWNSWNISNLLILYLSRLSVIHAVTNLTHWRLKQWSALFSSEVFLISGLHSCLESTLLNTYSARQTQLSLDWEPTTESCGLFYWGSRTESTGAPSCAWTSSLKTYSHTVQQHWSRKEAVNWLQNLQQRMVYEPSFTHSTQLCLVPGTEAGVHTLTCSRT